MRMPNGYGSVVNLGKGRRKPFAVRITAGTEKKTDGSYRQKYKYLEYFEKRKDAIEYLARYNSGIQVKEHTSVTNQLTFAEMYEKWVEEKRNQKKKLSESSFRQYQASFNLAAVLHDKKFVNIRAAELQAIANENNHKSRSVMSGIKILFYGLYDYALRNDIVDTDYSKKVKYEYDDAKRTIHTTFSEEEIKKLWESRDIKYVDYVLIMIYMGWRADEFCELRTENIHLEERYIVGGKKTDAGTDRIVPIHKRIEPIIRKYYTPGQERFVKAEYGSNLSYKNLKYYWDEVMTTLDMKHLPHDSRYTTATLLDRYGANKVSIKKILGHKIQDITDGVYTQKSINDLIEAIDVIP